MRFVFKQLVFLALWSSGPVMAIGLGDVRLFSYLNEPLDAEIQLISAGATKPGSIEARLLINGDERPDYELASSSSLSLRFKVVYPKNRPAHVKVTSTRRVREPVVAFTLELVAPHARVQREYALLLDPPASMTDPLAQSASDRKQPTSEPAPDTSPARKPAEGATYGPVGDGDTLSHIALRTRPGRDISIHRMTQALFRRNPDAFINGNINLLRKGAWLEVPAPDELRSTGEKPDTGPKTSAVVVNRQVVQAQETGAMNQEYEKPPPRQRPPAAKEDEKTQNVLRLVTANSTAPEVSRSTAQRKRLKQELGDVSQHLESVRKENQVLKARVAKMELLLRDMREQARRMAAVKWQPESAGITAPRPVPASKTRQPNKIETLGTEPQPLEQSPAPDGWVQTLFVWLWWVSLVLAVAVVLVALSLLRRKDEVKRARQTSLLETDEVPKPSARVMHDVSDVPTEEADVIENTLEQEFPKETERKFLAFLRTEIAANAAYGRYSDAKKALDQALDIAPSDIALLVNAFELARLQDDAEGFAAWVNRAGEDLAARAPAIWRSITREGRAWIPDHPVWRMFETTDERADAASNL